MEFFRNLFIVSILYMIYAGLLLFGQQSGQTLRYANGPPGNYFRLMLQSQYEKRGHMMGGSRQGEDHMQQRAGG